MRSRRRITTVRTTMPTIEHLQTGTTTKGRSELALFLILHPTPVVNSTEYNNIFYFSEQFCVLLPDNVRKKSYEEAVMIEK